MTDEQRAAIMKEVAEAFLVEADKKYNGPDKVTNGQLFAEMLGTVAGACAVMLAAECPPQIVYSAVRNILMDMLP